jgi:two-component system sensor histidine kinase CpxA
VDPELSGPLWVRGDPELLRRAVENVVRNAIRHAPADSAVEVVAAPANGRARVVVRDYGPGVPEEHRKAIFEPFFRVEPDRGRESGGAGLGLSIAKRAVELHNGTIAARNAKPGLVVEIDLPGQSYTEVRAGAAESS